MDNLTPKTFSTSRSITYSYHYSHASGAKPTILFCHGWGDSGEIWSSLAGSLIAQGYGAVVPDLLGYGGSSKPTDPDLYNMESQAQDMVEILDKEGVQKVITLGHDTGCHLASRVILFYPDRVMGLVILNVPYSTPRRMDLEAFLAGLKKTTGSETLAHLRLFSSAEGYKLLDEKIESLVSVMFPKQSSKMLEIWGEKDGLKNFLESGKMLETADFATPEFKQKFISRIRQQGGFQTPCCWQKAAVFNHTWDREKKLTEDRHIIRVPTLYIGGTRDSICPPALIETSRPFIPDLSIAEIDASHWIQYEKPKELDEAVSGYLRKRF